MREKLRSTPMRVLYLMILLPFSLMTLNCTPHLQNIRAKGPPSGFPTSRSVGTRKRLPCEKEPNPRPVCFSCKNAVKISIKLDRLEAWPAKCAKKIEVQRRKDAVKCKGKLAKKEAVNKGLIAKNKRITEELGRGGAKVTTYVAAGVVGLAIGIAAGVLGTVLVYQFTSPSMRQGAIVP